MKKPQNGFLVTNFPNTIPADIRDVLQNFAQSIEQLVMASQQITPAASVANIINGGKAGNFNGIFLTGTILSANTGTTFQHGLGRTPVGALELMALPQVQQLAVPVAQVASAIALLKASNNQVTLTSTAANRQFTLILM